MEALLWKSAVLLAMSLFIASWAEKNKLRKSFQSSLSGLVLAALWLAFLFGLYQNSQ